MPPHFAWVYQLPKPIWDHLAQLSFNVARDSRTVEDIWSLPKMTPKKTHDSSWNLAPQNAKGPWKCSKNSTANSVLIQSYNSRHDSTKMPWEVIWIAEMFFDWMHCRHRNGRWNLEDVFSSSSPEETIWYVRLSLPRLGGKLAQERYGWLLGGWKWVARKFTKEMGQIKRWRPEMYARDGRPMHFGSVIKNPRGATSMSLSLSLWTYLRWTWDSYTVRSSDMQT